MSGGILHFPWTTQPQSPVDIDPKWLARGLTFLNLGNGRYWQKGKGWIGTGTIVGGPKNTAGKLGVSKGFGATLGTGTTDRIDAGYVPVQRAPYRSIVAHIFLNGGGGGGLGRIFQDVSGTGLTGGDESLYLNTGGAAISYVRRAATNGQYVASSQPTGRWSSFGVSHDQTTVGVAPKLYIDAIESSVTVNTNSTGSFTATGTTLSWGNRADGARNWDGLIGPVAFFDCLLTREEHKALNDNIWQLLAPVERKIWVPNAGGGSHPSSGALASSAATIAGTATHLTLHTTSGALAASDATIAGSANRSTTHPTSGALVASDAVIAGAATHLTLHTSSGSLVAGDAELAGAADHSAPGAHTTSGALAADVAVIAGSAAHLALHTSTGALVADSASIAGTALHTPIHAASGGLVASEGALLGIALRTPAPTAHDATGGLVAGAAEIAGLATGPALPFFSVSGGGIKPKHHKKPTPSLFDEELKAPTAKLKKAVVPSFTPSTFVPYAKMGVPKALSKALGEVLVGPLSAPLREVLPPEYDDDDIPDEVIMLALQ